MSQASSDPGIVYVLVNEAMPGLIKIGLTRRDLRQRMKELDVTGVPLPFDVHHASQVANAARAEQLIHRAFSDRRVRSNREFFRLDPDQAAAVLMLVEIENVTGRAQDEALSALESGEDRKALQQKRRRTATFEAAGIPVGTEIEYDRSAGISARVNSDRTVEYEGEEWSLSGLTAHLMKSLEGREGSYNGWEYWRFDGERLADIWRQKMSAESDSGPSSNTLMI